MPEPAASWVVILLSCGLALLGVLLVPLIGIFRCLARIERRLAADERHASASHPAAGDSASGGAFETFLNEEPGCRMLAKSEQFAAYRRWRQQHGLNWSNP